MTAITSAVTAPAAASATGALSNTPAQTASAAVEAGAGKALLSPDKMLVAGVLAGAYIAFGSLVAIVCTAGLTPDRWGGVTNLITGLVFSLGLILCVIGGAELVTGNMALLPIGMLARRVTAGRAALSLVLVTLANLGGALLVAYFLAYKTGIVGHLGAKSGTPAASAYARLATIDTGKGVTETYWQVLLRAIGCNWLVCLAVWLALAAKDVGGKILAILFPITAFVAMGFDHVVANFFFLPLGHFAGVPGLTVGHTVARLAIAWLGNLIGASVFVAAAYHYLYGRGRAATSQAGTDQAAQPYAGAAGAAHGDVAGGVAGDAAAVSAGRRTGARRP